MIKCTDVEHPWSHWTDRLAWPGKWEVSAAYNTTHSDQDQYRHGCQWRNTTQAASVTRIMVNTGALLITLQLHILVIVAFDVGEKYSGRDLFVISVKEFLLSCTDKFYFHYRIFIKAWEKTNLSPSNQLQPVPYQQLLTKGGSTVMKKVAGTAGTPAEPYEQYWGTIFIYDEFTKENCT